MTGTTTVARRLLAEVARAGATITAEGGRLFIEPAGRVSPALLGRLRDHRAELLAALAPATEPPSADPLRASIVSQALGLFAKWGPITTSVEPASRWSRSTVARRLRWLRRGGERREARRVREAWRAGLAEASVRGMPPSKAAAAALARVESFERGG